MLALAFLNHMLMLEHYRIKECISSHMLCAHEQMVDTIVSACKHRNSHAIKKCLVATVSGSFVSVMHAYSNIF